MERLRCRVAADFGGGSGRIIAGVADADGHISIEEMHRFANRPVRLGDTLVWDFPALLAELKEGLRRVNAKYHIDSIGIDTWGVDFGLIDDRGHLLGLPVCYRDEGTSGMSERLFGADYAAHFAESGIQIMDINTLQRLRAMRHDGFAALDAAHRLLFMPDLFAYYLTGVATNEYTIASTSELLVPGHAKWNTALMNRMGINPALFGDIVMPGQVIGRVTESVRAEVGIDYDVEVIAVGSHDTASAIYASGVDGESAFISSGTWSLLGVITDTPILTAEACAEGFSNEGSVTGHVAFLQNITGLWIMQRLLQQWKTDDPDLTHATLAAEAAQACIASRIDVDHPDFAAADVCAETVIRHCTESGSQCPATRGEVSRVVLQSLADKYARAVQALERILGRRLKSLHIVGGGVKNTLLNRLTAEATGLQVVEGPSEATAIGNLSIQFGSCNNH